MTERGKQHELTANETDQRFSSTSKFLMPTLSNKLHIFSASLRTFRINNTEEMFKTATVAFTHLKKPRSIADSFMMIESSWL